MTQKFFSAASALKPRFFFITKRIIAAAVIASALAFLPARSAAQVQEDEYLRIFDTIMQGDTLSANGKTALALAKYHQAQTNLWNLQRTYPDWDKSAVAFRMNDLTEKIAKLEKPAATVETNSETAPRKTSSVKPATALGQVKLLDAGTEPRKVLRLHPKPGDKQTIGMTMTISMGTKMGDAETPAIKMPPITMTMDTTVKDVSTDGDITYDMVMGDATVGEDPGVMPAVAAAMKAALGNIKGVTGTGTISSRGVAKRADIKMPATADPGMSQTMSQMKDAFSRMSVPLPQEPVGIGAKWEVHQPVKSQGMTIDQTATYQLVTLDGDRCVAKTTLAQHAANQKIQNSTMPGLKLDLTKMTGSATGEMTFDLTQLMPPKGNTEDHTEIAMAMNAGGKPQTMTMQMDMNIRFESK